MLDYKALSFWLQFIQAALTGGVFLYVWLTSRQKANTTAIKEMNESLRREINKVDDRLIQVEKDIEHAPSRADFDKMSSRINGISDSVNHVEGELKQINNTLRLINEHLLNQGSRK